jgi:ATP-binding cassette subfamily F protein 3
MVDKIERIVEIDEDKSNLKIDFKVGKPSGKVVMDLNEIQQGFDNQILFDRVNREIVRGDKIALIGANGTGKSTFLSIIANEIDFEGLRKEGHQVISSFYAQHQLESLHLDYEILEELQYDAPHKTEMELRNMLGCFLFGGDDVFKKIKVLSGGEKARVSLAKTLVSEANFLLLDEPTNHLDIDSIEIIIEALKRYEGTLIFVSHNRYFIEKLANKVWWIEDQDVKEYPGNYSEYLYKVQQSQNPLSSDKLKKKGQKTVEDKSSKDSWKRKNEKEERIKKLQKKLDQIEEQIKNSQNHLKNLEVKLSSIDVTKQEEYENISKEYADTTLRVNQLTKESEILIEEIISLE